MRKQLRVTSYELSSYAKATEDRRVTKQAVFTLVLCLLWLVLLPGLCLGATTNQISQFGITWTFDKEYEYGQFANGDYWVVGPVTIIGINPPSKVGLDSSLPDRIVHGSMINPDASNGDRTGYDSNQCRSSGYYIPELNVARPNGQDLSASNPLIIQPDASLMSVVSRIPQPIISTQPDKADFTDAAVLTILSSAPPEGSFRPAYSSPNKTIPFNVNDITDETFNLFANLTPTASMPRLKAPPEPYDHDDQNLYVERMFERVWLDHWGGDRGEHYISALHNEELYGRQISRQIGVGALMLNLDYSGEPDFSDYGTNNAYKERLLIHMVQRGIDAYGILTSPNGENVWRGEGGHNSGRFFLILLAGLVLNDSQMISVGASTLPNGGPYHFGEIDQTFYVEETSPGVYNYGKGGYSAADVGLPDWSQRHWWALWDENKNWESSYRHCCTVKSWAGYVLASHLMGIKELWKHNALFDYLDRWMEIQNSQQDSPFTREMWNTYRTDYGCVWTRDNPTDIYSNGRNPCDTPGPHNVVIGSNNELIVNSEKVFPIFVWDQRIPTLDYLKGLGINTIVGYDGGDGDVINWLDAGAARGMFMVPHVDYILGSSASQETLANHPALIAGEICHEPEGTIFPPEIQAKEDNFKSHYPNIPTLTVFSIEFYTPFRQESYSYYYDYLALGDIMTYDYYPVTGWNKPDRVYQLGEATNEAYVDYLSKEKPIWPIIEASDQDLSWTDPSTRGPYDYEMRTETWLSIVNGAKAIGYFTIAFNPFRWNNLTPEIEAEMIRTNAQITALKDIILAEEPTDVSVSVSATNGLTIRTMIKKYDNKVYIFAVEGDSSYDHTNRQSGVATFTLTGVPDSSIVNVYDESRTIQANVKSFTDNFNELGVHIYEYIASSFLYGDVNENGEVTSYDAALVARYAVGLETFTDEQRQRADVSGNGEVSAYDAALIAQRAVGLIDRFPVEQ